jgi:hypothetical protein
MRAGIGVAGFFSSDFGGGFRAPEVAINNITIPGAETKAPWLGGGVRVFFDATSYAEAGVGLTFGSGAVKAPAAEAGRSFLALNFSLLGRCPIVSWSADNSFLFLATGIDYQLVLSGEIGEADIAAAGDDSALWFKFGAGVDIAVGGAAFIRPTLLYGIRLANQWEVGASRPVIAGGEEGSTRLGHGLTFGVGVGFRL